MLMYIAINLLVLICQVPFFWFHLYGKEYPKKNRNIVIHALILIIIHVVIPMVIRFNVQGRVFGMRPFAEM